MSLTEDRKLQISNLNSWKGWVTTIIYIIQYFILNSSYSIKPCMYCTFRKYFKIYLNITVNSGITSIWRKPTPYLTANVSHQTYQKLICICQHMWILHMALHSVHYIYYDKSQQLYQRLILFSVHACALASLIIF